VGFNSLDELAFAISSFRKHWATSVGKRLSPGLCFGSTLDTMTQARQNLRATSLVAELPNRVLNVPTEMGRLLFPSA
jgi:hypothetical protein